MEKSDYSDDQKRRWGLAVSTFRVGDKAGALFMLNKLAEERVQPAYVEVGKIYELGGGGVIKDFDQALRWYRKSVYEADDVNGHLALARMYYQGKGVSIDYKFAFKHYSLAVLNEKPLAHLMLARMHWLGQGVPRDVAKAKVHYVRAKELGNLIAVKELGFVERHTGRYWHGLWLGIVAAIKILRVGLRNPNDPRLERI